MCHFVSYIVQFFKKIIVYKFPTGGESLLAVHGRLDGQFTYRYMCTECLHCV